jgi:hypothetical protein
LNALTLPSRIPTYDARFAPAIDKSFAELERLVNAPIFAVITFQIDIGEFLSAYLKAQKNASSWLKFAISKSLLCVDQIWYRAHEAVRS